MYKQIVFGTVGFNSNSTLQISNSNGILIFFNVIVEQDKKKIIFAAYIYWDQMETCVDFESQTYPLVDDSGNIEEIPALDARWVERKKFPLYRCLNQSEQVKIDAWCYNMEMLNKQCDYVLRLPCHKFWSFIIYGDSSFHEMLDSYLEFCPKFD
uniref:Uncharacterized protein n=1 Tax=Romanomermis culicivorax TaxID=13658 RepID=A0A915IFX8_ROMCU